MNGDIIVGQENVLKSFEQGKEYLIFLIKEAE